MELFQGTRGCRRDAGTDRDEDSDLMVAQHSSMGVYAVLAIWETEAGGPLDFRSSRLSG